MMLRTPSGAKVRCEAHRTYALVVEYDGEATTLFRTSDLEALRKRGRREASKRPTGKVYAFRLRDGLLLGTFESWGVFTGALPVRA